MESLYHHHIHQGDAMIPTLQQNGFAVKIMNGIIILQKIYIGKIFYVKIGILAND